MKSDSEKHILTRIPVVISIAFFCCLLWGSAYPTLKISFGILHIEENTGGKIIFASLRFLLAGILLFAGLRIAGQSIKLTSKKEYAIMLLLGIMQTTLLYTFFYIGLSNTTGVKGAIINASASFFMAGFSHLFIGNDNLSYKKIAGLIIGFTGVIFININRDGLSASFSINGELFILIAAIIEASSLIIVKKTSLSIDPPLITAYQLTTGSIILMAIGCMLESPASLSFTPQSSALLVYLSFLSATAFSLWYLLIKYNDLSKIAVYRFMLPICGTMLSVLFLDSEYITSNLIISLVLVSGGIILVNLKTTRSTQKITGGPRQP